MTDPFPATRKLATAPHAVSRLRAERLARSSKPFLARGGMKGERCPGCRINPSHCICGLRPQVAVHAGVCLIMADIEPLKPSNTGWLIADVVPNTWAFGWARTEADPALLALLADPQWQPYVVFPGEFVDSGRVVNKLPPLSGPQRYASGPLAPVDDGDPHGKGTSGVQAKQPLFILLDATWPEARKMFRKSPYLDRFAVLSLRPEQMSRYALRRSRREDHFCTSEVGALCLELAGHTHAAQALEAWLDVYTHHYLQAKHQLAPDLHSEAHQRLARLAATS
ncbi:MAG: DTW domain-containing protein [Rhodoferax sp.]|nr:DTW domain-containing protein [Rhodoferax sp.]